VRVHEIEGTPGIRQVRFVPSQHERARKSVGVARLYDDVLVLPQPVITFPNWFMPMQNPPFEAESYAPSQNLAQLST